MALIEIDRYPSRGRLNAFGLAWLVFVGAAGAMLWRRFGPMAGGVVCAAAGGVPLAGWLSPRFMRWVYLGLCYATWPVGVVVSFVVLAGVYYLVFTPIGLAMRLCGYDPMRRRLDRGASSYWQRRQAADKMSRYFDSF